MSKKLCLNLVHSIRVGSPQTIKNVLACECVKTKYNHEIYDELKDRHKKLHKAVLIENTIKTGTDATLFTMSAYFMANELYLALPVVAVFSFFNAFINLGTNSELKKLEEVMDEFVQTKKCDFDEINQGDQTESNDSSNEMQGFSAIQNSNTMQNSNAIQNRNEKLELMKQFAEIENAKNQSRCRNTNFTFNTTITPQSIVQPPSQ